MAIHKDHILGYIGIGLYRLFNRCDIRVVYHNIVGWSAMSGSRFFMVSVTSGQEEHIARMVEIKVKNSGGDIRIKSVFKPPHMKGVLVVEAAAYVDVVKAFENIKYFKKILPGVLSDSDLETLLEIGKEEEVIEVGDLVEVTSGPFRGMVAKVINIRGEKDRKEAVIQLQDASISPIPIIISLSSLKKKED